MAQSLDARCSGTTKTHIGVRGAGTLPASDANGGRMRGTRDSLPSQASSPANWKSMARQGRRDDRNVQETTFRLRNTLCCASLPHREASLTCLAGFRAATVDIDIATGRQRPISEEDRQVPQRSGRSATEHVNMHPVAAPQLLQTSKPSKPRQGFQGRYHALLPPPGRTTPSAESVTLKYQRVPSTDFSSGADMYALRKYYT